MPDHPSNPQELDIERPEALLAYLRAAGHVAPDETPVLRRLDGGVSNRTMWIARPNGETWVVKQALAKLRVQVDWFSSPERIHREADGLRWLQELAPPGTVPRLVFEDHAAHLIAMEAVPEPHSNWKSLLLDGELERDHVTQFAVLLAMIHANSFHRRDAVRPVFVDRGFFESLRLEPYYGYTAEQVPAARAFLSELIAATRQRACTLVHGDYSPKNVLVHAGRLTLLDHEVIHWGDPAFDLGFSITHFLSKANHLPHRRADFANAARHHWATYFDRVAAEPWADELETLAARHTLACLLARVRGRSPLEYLSESSRRRQEAVVVALLDDPPPTIDRLISRFVQDIEVSRTD
ncbi:MAG: phosphotransferase [Planctomycetaceae bacterium]